MIFSTTFFLFISDGVEMSCTKIEKPGNEKVQEEIAKLPAEKWRDKFIETRKENYGRIRTVKYSEYTGNAFF